MKKSLQSRVKHNKWYVIKTNTGRPVGSLYAANIKVARVKLIMLYGRRSGHFKVELDKMTIAGITL